MAALLFYILSLLSKLRIAFHSPLIGMYSQRTLKHGRFINWFYKEKTLRLCLKRHHLFAKGGQNAVFTRGAGEE